MATPGLITWNDDDVEWLTRRSPTGDVHIEARTSEGVILHTLLPAECWATLVARLSARGDVPVNLATACALHGVPIRTRAAVVEPTPLLGYMRAPTMPPALPRSADLVPVRLPGQDPPSVVPTDPAPPVRTERPPALAPVRPRKPVFQDLFDEEETELLLEEPTMDEERPAERGQTPHRSWWPF